MLTKRERATWQKTEDIRETLTRAYYKDVQRSIRSSVNPIIKNLRNAQTLDQMSHIIAATNQDPAKLITTLMNMYIKVGTLFAMHILETLGLKSFVFVDVTTKAEATAEGVAEPTIFQQAMRRFAATVGASRVTNITATNEAILLDIVTAATENGWSVPDTVKHMVAFFNGEITAARAVMIARTEIMTASSYATDVVGEVVEGKVGIRLKKKWLPTPTGKFRPTHLAMGGKPPILYGDMFNVGGVLMKHPHDPNAPASEVINCRCSMSYVPIR